MRETENMTDEIYFPTDEELDAEVDAHLEALDARYEDYYAGGYEPYEPNPYDGTYSEM